MHNQIPRIRFSDFTKRPKNIRSHVTTHYQLQRIFSILSILITILIIKDFNFYLNTHPIIINNYLLNVKKKKKKLTITYYDLLVIYYSLFINM